MLAKSIPNLTFLSTMTLITTETSCEKTVAMAAPATSMPKPPMRIKSPTMFTMQAMRTKRNGSFELPSPLMMQEMTL